MKPSLRDYLAISAALLAILLCGYGIGFLVGERSTLLRLNEASAVSQGRADWASATVQRLTRELSLSPAQQAAVTNEVALTAPPIATARHQAMRQYRRALIDLHQRLLPHLDAKQCQLVEESRRQLQLSLDKDTPTSD